MNRLNQLKGQIRSLVFLCLLTLSFTLHAQNCSVNAGSSFSICPSELPITLSGNVSMTNVVQSSMLWSVGTRPSGSSVTINSPQSIITSVNGTMPEGDYTFILGVSCTDGNFIQDSIILTIASEPTLATISTGTAFGCYDGTGIPLSGNAAGVGETAAWRVVTGESGFFNNPSISSPIFFPNADLNECKAGLNGYVSRLEYRIYNGNCFSSDFIDITFTDAKDTFYIATQNALTCGFCTNISGACALDGTGVWTASGPGNAVFNDNANSHTEVCVDQAGEYTFNWTVTGGCRTGSKDVSVVFQEFGEEGFRPNAGANQVYCEIPPSTSLTATPYGNGQTGGWFQIKGLPAVIEDPFSPSTQIDSLQANGGPYWFLWSVTGLDCILFDTVKVYKRPSLAFGSLFDQACSPTYNVLEDEILNTESVPFDALDDFEVSITFLEVPEGYEDNIVFYPEAHGSTPGSVAEARISLDVFNDGSPKDTAQVGVPFLYIIPANLIFQKASSAVLSHEEFSFVLNFDKYQPRGNYKYVVTVRNSCGSISFEREYMISGFSALIPKAGSDVRLNCGVTNASLAGTGMYYPNALDLIKIHTAEWNTVSTLGPDPISSSNKFSTNPQLDNLNEGVHTFRYLSVFGKECDLKYDDVRVYVSTSAASGINAYLNQPTVCGTGVAQLIAESGTSSETGTWTQVSPPVTTEQIVTSTSQDTAYLFDLIPSTSYTIAYTNNNSCGGGSDTVYFTTDIFQGPSFSSISEEFACITTSTYNLVADPVTFGQGTWSVVSAPGGASPLFSVPDSNITDVSGLSVGGNYLLKFSISNPPCAIPSEDYISIAVGNAPILGAGDNINNCQAVFPYTENMTAESPIGGAAYWEFISGPSVPDIADPNLPTTSIIFKGPGAYRLAWVSSYGRCSQEMDFIEVNLGEMSTIAQAGPDQERCGVSGIFTLDAVDLAPSGNGIWSVVSTTGSMEVVFTDSADPNTNVMLSNSGVAVLRWTTYAKTGVCNSTDDEVVVEWHASAAAGDDFSSCNSASIILTGNDYSGIDSVDVLWTVVGSPPSTPNFESNTEEFTVVNGLVIGVYVFNYQVTTNLCTTNENITVEIVPVDVAIAGDDQVACLGTTISLSGNMVTTGASMWYLLDGEDVGSFSTLNTNNTTYGPSIANENYIFAYSLDNGTCITYDYMRVYVLDNTDVSEVVSPSVCGSSIGSIAVDFDDIPTNLLDFSWSNGATTQNISNLSTGVYDLTVSSDIGCNYTVSYPVPNSNGPLMDFGGQINICPGGTAVISPIITGGTPPYTYRWEGGETSSSISVSPLGDQNYEVTVTDNASCNNISFATVKVNDLATIDILENATCSPRMLSASVIPPAGFTARAPFNETDFATGIAPWKQGADDDLNWTVVNPGSSAAKAAALGTAAVDQQAKLYSPVVNLSGRLNVYFEFDYVYSGSFARDFYLEIRTDSAAAWAPFWNVPSKSTATINVQLSLEDYIGMPSVELRFVAITGNTVKCNISLDRLSFQDAKSAYSYVWSTGETTQEITIPKVSKDTVTYTVTLTDPNGCSVQDSLDVIDSCLPITMSYFNGSVNECRVKIFWETLEEIDFSHFEVEKSRNGIDFRYMGSISALGGENPNQYELYDEEPQNINYYRLKIVDIDGSYEYYQLQLPVTTECFENRANGISEIYPNPTSGEQIFLKYYTQISETITIEILDVNGIKVSSSSFQSTIGADVLNIDIKKLPAGVYFVSLSGEGWKPITRRVVKVL